MEYILFVIAILCFIAIRILLRCVLKTTQNPGRCKRCWHDRLWRASDGTCFHCHKKIVALGWAKPEVPEAAPLEEQE